MIQFRPKQEIYYECVFFSVKKIIVSTTPLTKRIGLLFRTQLKKGNRYSARRRL